MSSLDEPVSIPNKNKQDRKQTQLLKRSQTSSSLETTKNKAFVQYTSRFAKELKQHSNPLPSFRMKN